MKTSFKYIAVQLLLLCTPLFLNAQEKKMLEKEIRHTAFSKIEAKEEFEIEFVKSDTYYVKWELESRLNEYVNVYVKDNTLYTDITRKGLFLLHKIHKATDSKRPVIKLKIYCPTISQMTLEDNIYISEESDEITADNVTIKAEDKVNIEHLKLKSDIVNLDFEDNVKANIVVNSKKCVIKADDKVALKLNIKSPSVNINLLDNSHIELNTESENLELTSKSSAKATLKGNTRVLKVEAKASSEVEAFMLSCDEVYTLLESATLRVGARQFINVNIVDDATLIYKGNPRLDIARIEKSTLRLSNE